jgi:hypothetical protein
VQYTEDGRKLAHAAKMEIEIEDQRRFNRMSRVAAEERMQKTIDDAQYQARNDERVASQNRSLAAELERRRAERERKERDIQRICEESDELKDLEKRLKLAYMNKERAAQHEEKVVLTRMEREQNLAMEDAMEVERQQMVAAELAKGAARRMVTLEQKSVLQVQIREREAALVEAAQEAVRDKAMVNEIVAQIEAEDARDYARKEQRKDETRAIIKAYEVQRQQEGAAKLAAELAQTAEIKRHVDAVANRNAGVAEARAAKEAAAAAAFRAIAEEAERKRLEDDEMDRLRDLLWAEELEASRRAQDEAKAKARSAGKAEMSRANAQMLAAKQLHKEAAAAEEARLVSLMMAKFERDENDERAAAARRAANRSQYQSDISAQKASRRAAYELERDAELAAVSDGKEEEEYRRAVVAEARRRLLQDHAKRLHGFLPKGALLTRNEKDVFDNAAAAATALASAQRGGGGDRTQSFAATNYYGEEKDGPGFQQGQPSSAY